jgi:hypothetical protein
MALVNKVMNLRIPYDAGKFFSSGITGSFSRRAQLHEVLIITIIIIIIIIIINC